MCHHETYRQSSNTGLQVSPLALGQAILPSLATDLDLYFRQTSSRKLAKIQSKSIRQPIKILLNNMTETSNTQDMTRPTISPIRLALRYASEMEKETCVNIQLMEEEPEYKEESIRMSTSAPQYWSRLGSSRSRTSNQQEQEK